MFLSQVPLVQNEKVYKFEVEVKGDTFYSKEVRKVKATFYQPMTFVQTDKPIYLPGQTSNFDLMIYVVVHNMLYISYRQLSVWGLQILIAASGRDGKHLALT